MVLELPSPRWKPTTVPTTILGSSAVFLKTSRHIADVFFNFFLKPILYTRVST